MIVKAYAVAAVAAMVGTAVVQPAAVQAATAKAQSASKPAPARAGARTVLYGPAPAWVKPAAMPPVPQAEPGAAWAIRLSDTQLRFGPDGEQSYDETAFTILSEEGLDAGSLTQEWDPDSQTVTINRLVVLRDGQVIDVLKSDKFEVLRRETNLDSAMLDGRLTAALQIKGLQVGDTIDLATTRTYRDPIAGGRPEYRSAVDHMGVAGRVRYRVLWPKGAPVRWRKGADLPAPTVVESEAGGELTLDLADIKAPLVPAGAPVRYLDARTLAFSGFDDWAEVSGLMAPLYAKAATLEADSPLKAEAARIRAASPDPAVRAALALKLVQSRVRYVFVGLNGGGRKPATADDTWRHRFGDCKGKTVLLLALLKELDIPAEAALVNSSGYADGLDKRLPGLDHFDHVIARVTVGERVYWLDGTRSGDEALANIEAPGFDWALPLRDRGGALERIVRKPAARPHSEVVTVIDASAGADAPAQVTVETIFRGDLAIETNRKIAGAPRDETRRNTERGWETQMSWVDFKDVDWTYDPAAALFVLTLRGSGKLDWWDATGGVRQFDVPYSQFGFPEFERDSAQDAEAPYVVGFPAAGRWVTAISLPDKGEGFVVQGRPVDDLIGGMQSRRITNSQDGRVLMLRSMRSMVPEITATEAKVATDRARRDKLGVVAIRTLAPGEKVLKAKNDDSLLAAGYAAWGAGREDEALRLLDKARDVEASRTQAWSAIIAIWQQRKAYDRALEVADQAARKDKDHPDTWKARRGDVLVSAGRFDEAVAEMTAAVAASPKSFELLAARARAYQAQGRPDLATQDLDRAVAVAPEDKGVLLTRAAHAVALKDHADAVRRYEALIAKDPDDVAGFMGLASAYATAGDLEEAGRQADEALRIDPLNAQVLARRAGLNLERKRYDQALADSERAVALRPEVASLWNDRCWARAVSNRDLDKALADCDAALKMSPNMAAAFDSRGLVRYRQGQFDAALRDYDAALALAPKQAASLYGRGLARLKLGQKAEGQTDLAAAVATDAAIGKRFEGYGLKVE
jgi:tetratricopeptide (TPR) repeat protein/transglutaminase-like putative cysteine protease